MVALNSRNSILSAPKKPIEFIDLRAQQQLIKTEIEAAVARVLNHGQYIMGPEVTELEKDLAAFSGVKHAISCSSGTDALLMPMMALGVGPGDAVICPAFTYTATPEMVALIGATPIFCDVDRETFNLDPSRVKGAIETARRHGLNPKILLPVDLFGQPADYERLAPIADSNGLRLICDAAQSFGALYRGKRVGQHGLATATSFFPAKPLGCYGDGGAILTNDDEMADVLRSIRAHGKGADKYDIARIGINGRLDTIQAAILIQKLRIFPEEIKARNLVARLYNAAFDGLAEVPHLIEGCNSVWAQYTLKLPADVRDAFASKLKADGVPTAVYYPRGVHEQLAYARYPSSDEGVPVATSLAREVISLPIHPYLDTGMQDWIIAAVKRVLE